MNDLEIQDSILEVSEYRSNILKEVDNIFSRLKKNNKDLAARKELTKKIKQFTSIEDVIITFKPNYSNAAVIPVYERYLSTDLINLFKDFEAGKDLKTLNVVEEPSKYIKKLYVIIGLDLINMFSPRELTSILLHELGHVYTYTSNLPRILLSIFTKLSKATGTLLKTPILAFLNLLSVPSYVIACLITVTLTRSLTFLEHRGEYRADQFPIKYGYGDEFLNVLKKLQKKQIDLEKQKKWYKKVWDFINDLFVPSSHPSSSKRIKKIADKMLQDYKKLYPHLNEELNIILNDIKRELPLEG